jgi:hypothetical protein
MPKMIGMARVSFSSLNQAIKTGNCGQRNGQLFNFAVRKFRASYVGSWVKGGGAEGVGS